MRVDLSWMVLTAAITLSGCAAEDSSGKQPQSESAGESGKQPYSEDSTFTVSLPDSLDDGSVVIMASGDKTYECTAQNDGSQRRMVCTPSSEFSLMNRGR